MPECGYCGAEVTPENVITFDWTHKDRATKTIGISQLVKRSKAHFRKQYSGLSSVRSVDCYVVFVIKLKPMKKINVQNEQTHYLVNAQGLEDSFKHARACV